MFISRSSTLSTLAAVFAFAIADPNSVCYSNGVDFVDEGHYFINTLSNEQFTCVSTFQGCNNDVADVLLVDPNGDEYLCDQIPTVPENTPELSTCPIAKSNMISGDWIVLILGNNDDGQPFAWERDLYLTCGPQATTTYTPTITLDVTSTPIITATTTSTLITTSTFPPTATFTVPSATAKHKKTVTPKPITTTSTKTFTRTKYTWTKELSVITKTKTATCTTSKSKPDKPCTYSPTLLHPAALETPTSLPRMHRYMRKADRAVDIAYARSRIEAAKLKRSQSARVAAAPLDKRAPDEPTLTITASPPVNTTITHTAPASTQTETTVVSSTASTTLPPVTVYSGVYTSTVTLPTPTKTKLSFQYAVTTSTKTFRATWTVTTTITPTASIRACKSRGGHFAGH